MNKLLYKYIVVEDDLHANAQIVKRMNSFMKWECIGATDSLSNALEVILQKKPDLLFLDWEIKGGNTFTILEQIKKNETYNPFIIYFTGFQNEQPQIPAELINSFQINKYLVKPIFSTLTENLEKYINEAEAYIDAKNKENFIWITTNNKEKIKVFPSEIVCISQSKKSPRNKIIHLNNGIEIEYKINWDNCEKIAKEHQIDYFFANIRESMINKKYIKKILKPYIYLSNNIKVEVCKNKWQSFFE